MSYEPEVFDPAEVVRGTNRAAGAVAPTLGPGGRAVFVPNIGRSREGQIVVDRLSRFKTRGERMGADWMRALSKATFVDIGDGAGRSVIIGNELFKRSVLYVQRRRLPPHDVARGIDKGIAALISELKNLTRSVRAPAVAARLASRTVGADARVGVLLGQALAGIGANGTVTFREGSVDGIRFARGSAEITL